MRTTILFGALSLMATAAIFVAPGCTVTMEGAAKSYNAALCEKEFQCYPFSALQGFGDRATCESVSGPWIQAMFALPDIDFDENQVQGCANAIRSMTCDEYRGRKMPLVCQLVGTRADQTECTLGVQCQSGYCDHNGYSCGVCVPLKVPGADCTDPSVPCENGTHCGVGHKCVVVPQNEGDACSYLCGGDLACNYGKCVAMLGEGAACGSDSVCNYYDDLACFPYLNRCVRVRFVNLGAPCSEMFTQCIGTTYCESTEDRCVARPKVGEACSPSEVPCVGDIDCVDGKCVAPVPATCD
ncbi:MAG: hypothetical protein U0441_31665 [Polyangiaceae bacterium]